MLYTNRYITSYMETLLNTISPIFKEYNFHSTNSNSNSNSNSKICYKSTNPFDEFIVELFPKTNEIITIVPIRSNSFGSIPYKKTFVNDISEVINYMKMHLDYYQKSTIN